MPEGMLSRLRFRYTMLPKDETTARVTEEEAESGSRLRDGLSDDSLIKKSPRWRRDR